MMQSSIIVRFGAALITGILLASCGAAQQGAVPPGSVWQAQAPPASAPRQVRHGISWMARGVQQRDLLYVSNGNGEVNVYRYWQRTLVGVLTNFIQPLGECSDWAGDVYIVDHQAKRVYEYAHGGTSPIKILDDSPNAPYACSVDLKTGDVAVANNPASSSSGPGNVAIFVHGEKNHVVYFYGKHSDRFIGCAYNKRGALFLTTKGGFNDRTYFYYLPEFGNRLLSLDLTAPGVGSGRWKNVRGVAWDGKYWVVERLDFLYRFVIKLNAQYVSETQLDEAFQAGPIAIYRRSPGAMGTQAVAGTGNGPSGTVEYWDYPNGGAPINHISKDLDAPFGVAISLRTR